jgi:transcriptional regulator with XRE-family HTH domain
MVTRYKADALRPHYIREHLKAANVSQAELARRMRTDKANVTRWIDEPQRVSLDVLSGVADALGLDDAGDLLRPPELARNLAETRTAAERLLSTLRANPKDK